MQKSPKLHPLNAEKIEEILDVIRKFHADKGQQLGVLADLLTTYRANSPREYARADWLYKTLYAGRKERKNHPYERKW